MNMEIGIICVWDFWGIAYECFGLWGREGGCDLYVCKREKQMERKADEAVNWFTSFILSLSRSKQTHNSKTLLIFAALFTDLKTDPF